MTTTFTNGAALTPPPPSATPEFVTAAVLSFIERNELWPDNSAQDRAANIATEWRMGIDAYDLAKELESSYGWDVCADDIETLDGLDGVIRCALNDARKAWATEHNIQPPLPIGTRVKLWRGAGVIAGLAVYNGATYRIKEDGCTVDGRYALVPFEQAVAEGGAA